MPEPVAEEVEADDGEGASLEDECRALFTETDQARQRLTTLANAIAAKGNAELAAVYREVSGTVLSLVSDLIATCGGGFADLEEDVERLYARREGEEPDESVLLEEDSKLYVAYFEQIQRLLEELTASSSDVAQKQIFETLSRMTTERLEFTKSITVTDDDDDGDDDEQPEDPKES